MDGTIDAEEEEEVGRCRRRSRRGHMDTGESTSIGVEPDRDHEDKGHARAVEEEVELVQLARWRSGRECIRRRRVSRQELGEGSVQAPRIR